MRNNYFKIDTIQKSKNGLIHQLLTLASGRYIGVIYPANGTKTNKVGIVNQKISVF